jgi:hypothetical protein
MKTRAEAKYYAGYSTSGQMAEFRLMPDVSPALVGKLNDAVRNQEEIDIDTNDIESYQSINWRNNHTSFKTE